MLEISNNGIILMTRGDTVNIPIVIFEDHELKQLTWALHPFTRLYFSVMAPGQSFETGVIRKIITLESLGEELDAPIVVKLTSSDTELLLPGNYTYEVKVVSYPALAATGQTQAIEPTVETIIPKKKFIILD